MTNNSGNKLRNKLDAATLKELATTGFTKALLAQQPVAFQTVARLRRVYPDKSPEELIKILNKTYHGTVTASGAGAGIAAVVPNGVAQAPATIADFATFLEASVLYVLTLAEIYGINVEDLERRKFLVMTALLGNSGTSAVTQALGKRTVPYWSSVIIKKIPMQAINTANKVLGPRFITKYGTKQGLLVLGKQLPLGLGAVVGAGGNAAFSYFVVRSAKNILQSPPENWDHLTDTESIIIDAEVIEDDDSLNS